MTHKTLEKKGTLKRTALFTGRRILDALNLKAVEKAHNSIAKDKELRYIQQLHGQIESLSKGEPAFVDKPVMKKTAEFLFRKIKTTGLKEAASSALANRAVKVASQISPHVVGDNVLDIGSGDGKVATQIALQLQKSVMLCDIVDYNKTELPLTLYDGKRLPFEDKTFDSTLLSVVLHHSNDPLGVLDEAFRVTSKRIIIIESVYFNEGHRLLNGLLDWAYNRLLNDPTIPVPWNFLRPAGWVQELEKRGGKIVRMEHLGIDIPIVPEWHVLYVVDLPGAEKMGNTNDLAWGERFTYVKNVLFNEDDLNCRGAKFQIIKFKPNSGMGPHYHKETTEVFYVKSGNAIIKINGKEIRCKPDDFILCKPGDVHEVINDRNEEFVLLIFKTNENEGDIKFC
ncbi:MAG: cupin domain-containing protein [Candidatus Micrarchaeota archaeon]